MPSPDLDALSDEELAAAEAGGLPVAGGEDVGLEEINGDVAESEEILDEDYDTDSEFGNDEMEELMDRGPDIEESVEDGVDESIFEENIELDAADASIEPEAEF